MGWRRNMRGAGRVLCGMGLLLCVMAAVAQDKVMQATPGGARYRDIVVGEGEIARSGDVATIHFVGWLDVGSPRKEIFNTRREHRPVSFVVGSERVMRGWSEGVVGMQAGGRRLVRLPPELAWGARGVPGVVPPHAAVSFMIELIELESR